jgi:8-oxo-dGTP pyrophosphatase MutT (NUDIX family)
MLPGGHVEAHENPAQAALRELREETGMTATLVAPPGTPLPGGFVEVVVPLPHWIVEEHVAGDREPTSHIHVDFLYVALASASIRPPACRPAVGQPAFAWTDASGIERLEMFDGTRMLARQLFGSIEVLAEQARGASCANCS